MKSPNCSSSNQYFFNMIAEENVFNILQASDILKLNLIVKSIYKFVLFKFLGDRLYLCYSDIEIILS